MPGSCGSPGKKAFRAPIPPAEAPMPTTGKGRRAWGGKSVGAAGVGCLADSFFSASVGFIGFIRVLLRERTEKSHRAVELPAITGTAAHGLCHSLYGFVLLGPSPLTAAELKTANAQEPGACPVL